MPKKKARTRATRGKKKPRVRRAPKPLRILDARPVGGRPSPYVSEYAHIASVMCSTGATDLELAQAFGVTTRTITTWKARHPEFLLAIGEAKKLPNDRVERALYHRAIGYSHEATKIVTNGSQIVAVNYIEHVPPETQAARLWLLNRDPTSWRDKQEVAVERVERHEQDMTDDELVARLNELRDMRRKILEGELVLPALPVPAKT
jgi:hypothetical protein